VMITEIKAVIYDFDGVIVDSREANRTYYNRLLRHFGLPEVQEGQLEAIYTRTSMEVIDLLFVDPDLAKAARTLEKSMSNEDITPLIKVEPYVYETLEFVRRRYRTAIATNRGKSLPLVLEFNKLTDYFDMTVSSSQVKRPKPHPEYLEIILREFSLAPRQVVYVGDAGIDARLAEAAGIRFIAYKNSNLPAWAHMNDHREIWNLLEAK
jgi:phosphoglycolate phosphatase